MPLQTDTIDLKAERTRLYTEMEEVAEQQAEWGHNDARAQQLLARGNELNNHYHILDWAMDEWGIETVELAGLSAGEINRVGDFVDEHESVRELQPWVAVGTRDAPYLEHDPDNIRPGEFETTVFRLVDDVPLAYQQWAEQRIHELTHMTESEGNAYLQLVDEKRRAQTPEGE